jgi:hypothetical protein
VTMPRKPELAYSRASRIISLTERQIIFNLNLLNWAGRVG